MAYCTIDGCEKKHVAKGYCAMHYQRLRKHNDVNTVMSVGFQRKYAETCSVVDCDAKHYSKGFCAPHYQQYRRGKPVGAVRPRQVRERGLPCLVCGSLDYEINNTQFCTNRCLYLHTVYNGNVPTSYNCGKCGVEVEYNREGKQRRPSNARLCDKCNRRKQLTKFIEPLAKRDGTDCQICFEPLDINLRGRTDLSVSVDHIQPVSYGGTEELENLRLAHLGCNRRRSNSVQLNTEEALL